ncbi:MAG TPA: hypothetical protein VI197_08545 [Polyangiaceae bacterium]
MLDWVWLLALGIQPGYDVVSVDVTHPHRRLTRVEYVVQAGNSPLNRFSVTHVRRREGNSRGAPLVLLSPFALPGAFYEVSENSRYEDSLAGRLAESRHDVWLVDQRRSGLAPGDCESGAVDCSEMLEWNTDAYVSDALLVSTFAHLLSGKKPVLGGFSAGANNAIATINRAPHRFSGLFVYEGSFYSEDPVVIEHNEGACAQLEDILAGGVGYDPTTGLIRLVVTLAAADPNGLSPIPLFPPGTTNQQALLFVFSAPPPPGALSPTPNFVRNLGDFSTFQFIHANQDRLELVGPMFDNYASVPALRDLACGLAGEDDQYYDNLDEFRGDVLMFLGGTGFGQSMHDTASLMTRARSITVDERPEFGEADAYFHHDWVHEFYEPLVDWLDD